MNNNTFCPWKWQEIVFNPHQNYLYSCCNTTVVTHYNDKEALEEQRQNLLDGIRDPSCDYCWKVEDAGQLSLRQRMLKQWNGSLNPYRVEVNIGNICDIQCSYCSPKFSSKWNTDIKKSGEYQIIFDKDSLKELSGSLYKKDVLIEFMQANQPSHIFSISGGEPLISPFTLDIIKNITVTDIDIQIPTNLIFTKPSYINDIVLENNGQNNLIFRPSIDGLGPLGSFLRSGFNIDLFSKNLDVLLTKDVEIEFLTLVTALSIWEFLELQKFIHLMFEIYGSKIKWAFEYCIHPLTHTFNILTEEQKHNALEIIQLASDRAVMKDEKSFIETIKGALLASNFDYLLRQDSQNFFNQFAERNDLIVPELLTNIYSSVKM